MSAAPVDLLELAARALGDILGRVMFVGGAVVPLWVTDPGAPPARPTNDVDAVVEILTRSELVSFEHELRSRAFTDDGRVICRWHHEGGLILDVMPTRPELLGFENVWQGRAIRHAVEHELPSGAVIRVIPPAYLLATKVEAFLGRGRDDPIASRDLTDIVALLDGREALLGEVRSGPVELREYLSHALAAMRASPGFEDAVAGQALPDRVSQERVREVVIPRLDEVIAAGPDARR